MFILALNTTLSSRTFTFGDICKKLNSQYGRKSAIVENNVLLVHLGAQKLLCVSTWGFPTVLGQYEYGQFQPSLYKKSTFF